MSNGILSAATMNLAEPSTWGGARGPAIAVLIPCHNEAVAIGKVVADFRASLPNARIYVYDNNSSDDTVAEARRAGATVRAESLQGKGNVVRRMFADIQADIYVLVDGDDTYDAATAPEMVRLMLEQHLDMVSGARINDARSRCSATSPKSASSAHPT